MNCFVCDEPSRYPKVKAALDAGTVKDEEAREPGPQPQEITRQVHEVVDAERSRAEIVRATEELRRAITSEIRAQESYEHARLEMEVAKHDLGVVRSELDEFKHDIDLLKLKEQVVERTPIEDPLLSSETEQGKHLEEMVSRQKIEEIIDRKLEGQTTRKPVPVQEVPDEEPVQEVKPDEEKKEPITIEERIEEIEKTIRSETILRPEKPQPVVPVQVKPEEKPVVPVVPVQEVKPDEAKVDTETLEGVKKLAEVTVAKSFYAKLLNHLDVYKYLIVRKEGGEPVVYHSRLRLIGILIGVGAGIPSGCLLLYVILLLAGAI
ncbi:hypothetical protein ES705_30991 [subsurface metagenome]